ncbi:MAG: VOC family protein [Candidatus Eremiobacteraeota bacterium]|nr:VOC family protein [Candidatus Eremiobacteraeota bacterium]
MQISVVTLYVDDIDRAVDFYTKKLGWQKTMDVPMGEDRWVTVAPAEESTAFVLSTSGPEGKPEKIGGMSGVILETDNVYTTHQQLKQSGVEFTDEPREEPWGLWAMFKDSEGNVHGLHSPVHAKVSSN